MKKVNKIKAGYKHTILGWIPEDWVETTFGDALTGYRSGSTPSRAKPEYFSGDILWITSGELNYNVITDTKEKITEQAVKDTNLKILEPGTFLMAITGLEAAGTRGSCGIVGKPATTNQSCMALNPKGNLDINFFFQYYIYYGDLLAFRYCQGTKQQSYNGETARLLPLNLPPLAEQQKIASILMTWDEAIQKTQQLIEQLKQRNKGLLNCLLTPKKYWKEFRIGSLIKEIKNPVEWNDNELYQLISVRRRSGGIFFRQSLYGYQILTKNLATTFEGDFLFSKMQIVHGASALVTREFNSMKVSGSYIIARAKDTAKLNMQYFNWYSKTKWFYRISYISSYGVHIEKMTFDFTDFQKHKILIPSTIEEQQQIVEVLENADYEVKLYEQKLTTLQQQKKGLMQRLLSGEVRVKI